MTVPALLEEDFLAGDRSTEVDIYITEGTITLKLSREETIYSRDPFMRVWMACLVRAVRDLFSAEKHIAREAGKWVFAKDQRKATSFDNVMTAFNFDPDEFRKLMKNKESREKIKHLAYRRGVPCIKNLRRGF